MELNEKIYLIILVTSVITLIFTALFLTYNCPECNETFSRKHDQPIIVYKIG